MKIRAGGPAAGRHAPCSSSGRVGFTLIEVVAALVVFTLGVLVAMNLADSLAVQVDHAALRTEVAARAQEKMEELERLPYDSLIVEIGSRDEDLSIQGRSYTRTTVVTAYGVRTVSIEVSVSPDSDADAPSESLLSYQYESW